MADFVIRIPRVSVAVSEAELVAFLVDAGDQVDGARRSTSSPPRGGTEIEAGASGTVRWTRQVGETYEIGAEIGVITH